MGAAVVVALEREARLVRAAARACAAPLPLAVSGIGARRARRAALARVDAGATLLLSIGFAGGLQPALAAGDLVVPDAVCDEHGAPHAVCTAAAAVLREALREALPGPARVHRGVLASVARPAATAADKRALAASLHAIAVDMESAAVARVARERGIGFAALRAVSDAATQELPRAVLAAVDPTGCVRPLALLLALARRPGELRALPALRRGVHAAEVSLAAALVPVLARLAQDRAARY